MDEKISARFLNTQGIFWVQKRTVSCLLKETGGQERGFECHFHQWIFVCLLFLGGGWVRAPQAARRSVRVLLKRVYTSFNSCYQTKFGGVAQKGFALRSVIAARTIHPPCGSFVETRFGAILISHPDRRPQLQALSRWNQFTAANLRAFYLEFVFGLRNPFLAYHFSRW